MEAEAPTLPAPTTAIPSCGHSAEREIRLYTPHSDAAMARARIAQQPTDRVHVSKLYPIQGGWAWKMCRNCEL